MGPVVRLLRLQRLPILQQLRLEEALLRADDGNWFLLNDGTPEPTIVMGISGSVTDSGDSQENHSLTAFHPASIPPASLLRKQLCRPPFRTEWGLQH